MSLNRKNHYVKKKKKIRYLHVVFTLQESFFPLLNQEAALASMDLRKWVWRVCTVAGLVFILGERE